MRKDQLYHAVIAEKLEIIGILPAWGELEQEEELAGWNAEGWAVFAWGSKAAI